MKFLIGRKYRPVGATLLAAGLAAGIGLTQTTHASFVGPQVTLDWNASGSGDRTIYTMHQDSDSYWFDDSSNAWVFQGGDNGSAWGLNWTMEAADVPGGAAGSPGLSQFINANLAVTNNTDTFQTFSGLVTFMLPKEFVGGTLMNGSVSVSVQDVFQNGAEVRAVDDLPIYQSFIDGNSIKALFDDDFSLIATDGGTESDSDSFGIPAPMPGPEALVSISLMLNFEVSPYDTANVVGTYEIASAIPAPGALALIAGFGLISSRRRRH
jgi:hypothetical protein